MRRLWVVFMLCFLADAAEAQEKDPEKLIKKGIELRKKRRDADALAVFREAHALRPTPRSLAQIALAEQALAVWVDAAEHLEEALAAITDPWIRSNEKVLKESLKAIEVHLATLNIMLSPPSAVLRVENRPRISGMGIRASCDSEILVEVSAENYLAQKMKLTPACGKVEQLEISLEKIPPPPEPKKEAPQIVAQPVKLDTPPSLRPYAWVTGGGAVLGLGTGVAFLFVREGHAKRYNDDARCLPANGLTRDQNCGDERDSADRAKLISVAGFVIGGAFAAASAALFLLDEPEERSEPGLSCGPYTGGAGLLCAGVFE
jgi:hypothetical protein